MRISVQLWPAVRTVALAAAIATLASCRTLGTGDQGRLGNRLVTDKQAPSTLISGSASCTVDAEKFDRTKIGDRTWCNWQGGDKPPGPAVGVATPRGT